MTAGRPSEYTAEMYESAKQYLAFFSAEDYERNVPSVADMAQQIGVARSTLYKWAEEHPEFSDILDNIMELQEIKLLRKGLNNEWNPTITKLMLTKHGYTDKTDVTSDGKALPTPIMNVHQENSKDESAENLS